MQATAIQQLTPAQLQTQLQANIDNMHWQMRQSERQQSIDHEHYMVDHLAMPIACVLIVAIIGFVVAYLVRKAIAADIQKNQDDNAADVREAQRILERAAIEHVKCDRFHEDDAA